MAPLPEIIMITVTAVIGIIALSAAIEGYFRTNMNVLFRIILGVGALMMIIPETFTDIAGVIIVIAILGLNYIASRKEQNVNIGV